MPQYVFILDRRDNAYPERYRVVGPAEDGDALQAAEGLTGTVPQAEVEAFYAALLERCPPGDTRIAERARASSWKAIEASYAGLFRD